MEDDEEAAALVKVLRFLVHQRFTGVWVVTPRFDFDFFQGSKVPIFSPKILNLASPRSP